METIAMNDNPEAILTCAVCGKPASEGYLHVGGFCSEICREILMSDERAKTRELEEEPLSEMPAMLTVPDFERWAHKLACHLLREITDEQKMLMNPMLLRPTELALELKSMLLDRMTGVEREYARGHSRLFSGGTYSFPSPIPREEIFRAAQEVGVIN
jgi:endogenous inhibitor of DNA gyrase (YacG/DUF329 family)